MSLIDTVCGSEVYDSVSLETYGGWVKGSSMYTYVGFNQVAYAL